MNIHVTLLALLCTILSTACSLSHVGAERDTAGPDAAAPMEAAAPRDAAAPPAPGAAAPDAAAPDAAAPDAAAPEAGLPDPELDCVPPLVADAELCVGWRGLAAPPCEVLGLVRVGDQLGIECGTATYLLEDDAWWLTSALGEPVSLPTITSRPDTVFSDALIIAELPDGSAVAPHGDVYAHPAAWRTDSDGRWRETLRSPSAFVLFGAALSDDEALFVGRDAFVFVRARRGESD